MTRKEVRRAKPPGRWSVLGVLTAMGLCGLPWGCTFEQPSDWTVVVGEPTTPDQKSLEIYVPVPEDPEEDLPPAKVQLVYCKDPRRMPARPSYCTESGSAEDALRRAHWLCKRRCGPEADCRTLWNFGDCGPEQARLGE